MAKLSASEEALTTQFGPHLNYPPREGYPGRDEPDKIVETHCCFCGMQCGIKLLVKNNKVVGFEPWEEFPFNQGRLCPKGVQRYLQNNHPDRLLHPLKRVGKRGEGKFEQISWDEALDTVAAQFERVKARYGNGTLFVPYGTGSYNQLNGSQAARRLMNLYGGCLGIYNSYSWAAINAATPTVYGTLVTGNQRQDWLNSRYILMWGWNPAEMRDGTNSDYFIKLARQNGARVVCIDPRHSLSAASLADEWIPIRPGTDAAMMSAMATATAAPYPMRKATQAL